MRLTRLTLLLVPSLGFASLFSPVSRTSPDYLRLEALVATGLIPGFTLELAPEEVWTRHQVAMVLVRLAASPARSTLSPEVARSLVVMEAEYASELAFLRAPTASTPGLPSPPPPAEDGLEPSGLKIRSRDGRGSARFGARVQLRHVRQDFEEPATALPRQDVATFQVRRAQAFANLSWHPKVDLRIMTDFGRSRGVLQDAVLRWELDPRLRIWLGQFKHPYARETVGSIRDQVFVDWSLANLVFGFNDLTTSAPTGLGRLLGHGMGRSPGIQLWGDLGENPAEGRNLRWFFNVANSRGENQLNENEGFSYAGKLELHPFGDPGYSPGAWGGPRDPKLSVDLAYVHDKAIQAWDLDGSGAVGPRDRHDRHLTNLGFVYKHRRFWATTEYFRQWLRPDVPGLARTGSRGVVAATSWMLVPRRWEVALRLSRVDPDRGIGGNDQWERMIGLSRYLRGHREKVSFDLAELEDDASPARSEDRARLQYQFSF